MNHIHQIIWNKNLSAWIVASELAKRGKKRGSIRRKAVILPLLLFASASFALPTGNEVVAGSVNVATPSAAQMQINQSSQKAIVNWQGFSIGEHENVNIQQPNANAALLNRVVGQDASSIQGKLNANGQVYLTNPNGVIFSKSAQVDVGGLIASTHAISNDDFLNGRQHFTQDHAQGSVINHGQIKTAEGGVVALIGEQVENTGNISTPKGTTALAAGKTVDLDMQGDGLVEVKITEASLKAQIENSGVIQADGGQVVMTAKAAGQLLNTVINNEGVIEARGLVERNGKIVLSGGDSGVVQVSGTLDASGHPASNNVSSTESRNTQGGNISVSGQQIHINDGAKLNSDSTQTHKQGYIQLVAQQDITLAAGSKISANNSQGDAGAIHIESKTGTTLAKGTIEAKTTHLASLTAGQSGKGGNIELLGERVGVVDKATINASGEKGGGKILVGGDYQGNNPDVQNAKAVYIGKDTTIKADAISNGDGGKVIAWSNEATRTYGNISAKGGSQSGNGGLIETSGHWLDTAGIRINASASKGHGGNWLLDPYNITIISQPVITLLTFDPPNWTAGAPDSVIVNTAINSVLNDGTDVTIYTGGSPYIPPAQVGNITVAADISQNTDLALADTTLTLKADNAIIIDFGVDISVDTIDTPSNKLNVILNADADGIDGGNIQMYAGSSISTNGGNIIMGGGSCTTLSCSRAASGYDANSPFTSNGIYLTGDSESTVSLNSGGGNISLQGQGINNPSAAESMGIRANSLNLNSGGGNIRFQGSGGLGGFSRGINLQDSSSLLSQGGAITLTGTGGPSATGNNGIFLETAVLNSGAGSMILDGRGTGTAEGLFFNLGTVIGGAEGQTGPITLIADTASGADSIIMQGATAPIIQGTGALTLRPLNNATSIGLKDGAGIFNLSSAELGDIWNGFTSLTIGNSAGTGLVTIGNGSVIFPGTGSGFDINILTPGAGSAGILQQGAITADPSKNIVLASGGSYNNTFGAGALNVSGSGRWLVYGADPGSVNKNGLTSAFRQYNTVYGGAIGGTGNGFIYASTPGQLNVNTTLTSGIASNTYGTAPTAVFGYAIGNPAIADNEDLAAISGTPVFTPTISSTTAAGGYTVNYLNGLSSAAGYTFVPGVGLSYTVNLALLNVAAIASSKTYGSIDPTLTYNATGFVNNESSAVLTGALSRAPGETVVGGPYAISQGSLASSNYIIDYTGADFTITPAALTAAIIGNPTKTYDGNTIATLAPTNYSLTGFIGTEGASVTQTVGTYNSAEVELANTVTATLAADDFSANAGTLLSNYTLPVSASGPGHISKAALTLTAAIIGDPTKTYDGNTIATLAPTNYSLTGFIGEQGASITQTVGTYNSADVELANTVTATLATADFTANDGTRLSNYSLPVSASGPGHISKAALTAAITGNPTKIYDGTRAATLAPANYNLTGFIGEQGAGVTQTAGTYNSANVAMADTVTATLATGNFTANDGTRLSNYSLPDSASGAGEITPATLTITANDDKKIYDGLVYTGGNGVTYTGLVNNETSSVLAGSLSYGGNSQGAINVGAYDIIPGGLTSANYIIAYLNGQLTIVNRQFFPDDLVTSFLNNIVPLVTSVTYKQPQPPTAYVPPSISVRPDLSVIDITEEYVGNIPQYCDDTIPIKQTSPKQKVNCQKREKIEHSILPTLKIKNSAGRVKRLQMSANKQFLSLLLEDGSVRIWDFQQGDQHQIETQNKNLALTDISAVDDKGELVSIASKAGIITQDHIIPTLDENQAMNEPDINQFMTSNDGSLLLVSAGTDQLSLWDSKHNKKLWQLPYERGVVNGLALADNKHYGAVLSRQPGSYVLLPTELQLKSLTDAVDIVDLDTGKIIKSLPNVGEQILSLQFKDNDTLQLKLASGELLDWSITTNSPKRVANFAETVTTVDADTKRYAYVLEDGRVRIGDGQGHVLLSIQNKENPFKDALLLEGDKKLLTVMANGELSLWDVASGKKMLRLFSTLQGWTVMDAFGRFDGSEEAMDNFSWSAKEEDIPLDSFSENYYEPGLLSNVMQNQDYLNSNPNMVKSGITLPPKVVLQIAEQQAKGDTLALQLDVYDRGGGIDKIHVYQNGRILSNEHVVVAQQSLQENDAEHRVLTLNITPSAGKNTLKVIASNDMGIENSSTELSFDGKTKAYASSLKLLTIGIDQYSDDKLNLDYSVTDADSIGQAIKNTSKVAASINLYNENATKPKILAELKELSQGVQQDVLVIYFAGHGLALGKEWYFLPYETKMQPSLEQIAATGITATELSDIFKNSKIQHILLMVDSCYSGAGMDAFSKLQNGQRYFTRKLSRSLGITVMTAATKDQKAFELKSLGHGLFTYLVTQELQEKDTNQPVTAHGIAENIAQTLPVFSKKMLGSSQEPAVYTKGNDFMLTDVLKEPNKGNASDSNIPVIAPKKLGQ